ncbi:hypothetical protein fh0823_23960 [Francisella halioticida]|uniref:hypothetical protein n=1 Tax=Francisella halioticida TaxID=549298 RepID=UPI001AFC5A80|nr:hypothetical protein [Francisella halioticida]BCD92257.1 hypothetical protein fh0823_23960 [Francisella halioticida]
MNIMVTDFNNQDNVCIFTDKLLTVDSIKSTLDNKNQTYSDIFEVKDDKLQFYMYEPYWL